MKIYFVILFAFLLSPCYGQMPYNIGTIANDRDTALRINEDMKYLEMNKLDIQVASNTYLNKSEANTTYLTQTASTQAFITKSSATATYSNLNNTPMFFSNAGGTYNMIMAYMRVQLNNSGDMTITNTTGATHLNLIFMGLTIDDTTNTVGWQYDSSVAGTTSMKAYLVDASDNFRLIYSSNWYTRWANIFVVYGNGGF